MTSSLTAAAAAEAITIARTKPSIPVEYYLEIGRKLIELRAQFASTKSFGLFIKKHHPEIAKLDAPTRSNCIRIVEALNGERDEDLLEVLEVSNLSEFHSSHPCVIIRHYKKRKAQKH